MAFDQNTINAQLELLAAHRRTLAVLLQQQALLGGPAYANPGNISGMANARLEINRIKTILRENGVQVEDEPNDEVPIQVELVHSQRAGGEVVMGDKVAGDKVGGDKVMGDKRTINTQGDDYAEGNIDKRQGVFVSADAVYGDVVGQQMNYYQSAVTSLDRQQQRNRRAMLTKVKTIWIDGLLEQSLAKELRIALDLTTHPDAVDLPLNALVQELHRPPQSLPAGTPIINLFDQMGGKLLILGAPGAGKTTLLLELARDLITRAEQDEGHPIPVVFNLSSWAIKRRPLKEWLVEELNTKYDVPRKLAQTWGDADVVLPLLDGLDEVAAEHRAACVEAINFYRLQDAEAMAPLAVCSRVDEYEALETNKLRLQGAVVVQPLRPLQIDAYLERAGEKLEGVRAALCDDAELGEMLDTPLMLSIVTLAYAGKAEVEVQTSGTPSERRWHLFDTYIAAMFARHGRETRYTKQQVWHCLSWLAWQLGQHSLTVFYVDQIQTDWLRRWTRLRFALRVGVFAALVSGLISVLITWLFTGLIFTRDYGWEAALLGGPLLGLSVALFFGPTIGLLSVAISYSSAIRPVETRRWSWRDVGGSWYSSLASVLIVVLIVGLFRGLKIGIIFGLSSWIVGWLVSEVAGGRITRRTVAENRAFRRLIRCIVGSALVGTLLGDVVFVLTVGLLGGLLAGLVTGIIPTQADGGKDIRRAARVALVGGLISWVVAWLTHQLGSGLNDDVVFVMIGGTYGWLVSWISVKRSSKSAVLQYGAVRRFSRNALCGVLIVFLFDQYGAWIGAGQIAGLVCGLSAGLVEQDITIRITVNEAIRRTRRNAVTYGLVFALVFGLSIGMLFWQTNVQAAMLYTGLIGLAAGLIGGVLYGGCTVFQHYTLRWLLYRNGLLPFRDRNLLPFLDHCAERIFLRKVGGGYIFVHRMLMEHFASLYSEQPAAPPK